MEPKKISFGFMKTKKVEKPVVKESRDYIECVEEKAIKVVGGEKITEKPALIIPMKPNTLVTAERLQEIAEKVEKNITEDPQPQIKAEPEDQPTGNETLDQMAVRELLEDAKKSIKVEINELTVPIPAKVVLEGEKESTLEDYESVPVQDFGMAMLRGMGWTPGKDMPKYKLPELRPKGLGLGADKVVKDNQKKHASKKNKEEEELSIVKNAFVKIVTGKYGGCYGKVMSLDEDNGRVMVDIPIKKETVSLSEFMLQPVTKAEFDKESRVINKETYDEYKKKENHQNSSRNASPRPDKIGSSSSAKSNDLRDKKERKDDSGGRGESYRSDRSSNGNRDRKRNYSSDSERDYRETKRGDSVERGHRTKKRDRSEDRIRRTRDSSSDDKRQSKKKRRDKSEERIRKRKDSSSSQDREYRKEKSENSRERLKQKRESSSPDRSNRKKKNKKKYSSNESLDSLSDEKKRKHKHKSHKKSCSGTESDDYKKNKRRSNTPEEKRDVDKKRKGKKKKRDRDRSPGYKKHRK